MPPRDHPPYRPRDLIDGKYAVRKILGEGGMAVVYAAVDTTCDRDVAVKVLRPSVAERHRLSDEQMRIEASTIVKLHERTPHVAEVFTAGVTADEHLLPYYVMERLWGTTLRAAIADQRALAQPFEILELTSTLIEVATGLAHAHKMNVVHGDVKPENVFIADRRDTTTIVKLLDFGVSALARGDARDEGESGSFAGSHRYAAPEQLDGRPPTPAVDVYALGLMLYEMLTFTLPHDRFNPALGVKQIALNVLREGQPRMKDLRPDSPPLLRDLVVRCLLIDPAGRPRALEAANLLRHIRASVERALLGGAAEEQRTANTEVDEPPEEVQRRWKGAQADEARTEPMPHAPMTPAAPLDDEIFFWDGDTDGAQQRTAPIPRAASTTEPIPRPPVRKPVT
jgi:serine/threonine protein kinase